MVRHLRKFKNKKFQIRILVIGVCCTIIAVAVTIGGMYLLTSNASNRISKDLISKLVQQINMNIDGRIEQIQSLLINITVDQQVIEILEKQNETKTQLPYQEIKALQDKMMQTKLICDDIHGMYIFDSKGTAYYSSVSPSLTRDYDIFEEEWYQDLENAKGILLVKTHTPERYIIDDTPVVSMVQRLENFKTTELMATIVVDIKTDLFDSIMKNLELTSEYTVLILDQDNDLIYSSAGHNIAGTQTAQIYEGLCENEQFAAHKKGALQLPSQDGNVFLEFATSPKTNWKIVCVANIAQISGFSKSVFPMAIALGCFTMTISIVCLILITMRNFTTLNQLKEGMDAVREGNYNLRVESTAQDEIGELCATYNQMVEQLNYLINSVTQLEKEKQTTQLQLARAELNALQAQINPHFIYNALETISMMAEINDDNETRQMATALGKLIRISVKGSHIVTVEEELEHVRNYLLIQQIRFDDKFHVTIQVEPQIMNCMIPKLILQPLIENCIHHGLELKEGHGEISIVGKKENDDIVFLISDNGVGISPDDLELIRTELRNFPQEPYNGRKIGLVNVDQRIRLRFPDSNHGLKIESKVGLGTKITVRLPML